MDNQWNQNSDADHGPDIVNGCFEGVDPTWKNEIIGRNSKGIETMILLQA